MNDEMPAVVVEFAGGRRCGERIQIAPPFPEQIEQRFLYGRSWGGKEPWMEGEILTERYEPKDESSETHRVYQLFVRPK